MCNFWPGDVWEAAGSTGQRWEAGCVLKAMSGYGRRSSSAQERPARVLEGLVAGQIIRSKFTVCSLCTKHLTYFIFDLHT